MEKGRPPRPPRGCAPEGVPPSVATSSTRASSSSASRGQSAPRLQPSGGVVFKGEGPEPEPEPSAGPPCAPANAPDDVAAAKAQGADGAFGMPVPEPQPMDGAMSAVEPQPQPQPAVDVEAELNSACQWLMVETLRRTDCDVTIHSFEDKYLDDTGKSHTHYVISVSVSAPRPAVLVDSGPPDGDEAEQARTRDLERSELVQKTLRAGRQAMQDARSDSAMYCTALRCFDAACALRSGHMKWIVKRRFTEFEPLCRALQKVVPDVSMPNSVTTKAPARQGKFNEFLKEVSRIFASGSVNSSSLTQMQDFLCKGVPAGDMSFERQTDAPQRSESSSAKAWLDALQWATIAQVRVHIADRNLPAAAEALTAQMPEHGTGLNVSHDSRELREALQEALEAVKDLTTAEFQTRLRHVEEARKIQYTQLIVDATKHLAERRAVQSLSEANQADNLADNDDEEAKAKAVIAKATTERDRQQNVKELLRSAVASLEDVAAQKARKHLSDALLSESDESTNEHQALRHLERVCEQWIEGNRALDTWRGEAAKAAFESAIASASDAAGTAESDGYYEYAEVQIQLSPKADELLAARLHAAKLEISRRSTFKRMVSEARTHLSLRKAVQSLLMLEKALTEVAANDQERKESEALIA
eukprot:COSAG02_NODE_3577_length_6537_cov_17.172414_6_plen_645_part_01